MHNRLDWDINTAAPLHSTTAAESKAVVSFVKDWLPRYILIATFLPCYLFIWSLCSVLCIYELGRELGIVVISFGEGFISKLANCIVIYLHRNLN